MNGFSEKDMQNLDSIKSIELAIEDFGRMDIFSKFKNLVSLTLINGIQDLNILSELWLNENQISKIENIHTCINLKALYLSNNDIEKIENLDKLVNLEKLWLCENKIQNLEGLENLKNLKELWIAGNQIETIKTSLDHLKNLKDLNISGNKICSFKEALNLNRLPSLEILAFYDPSFGDNPICNLCNYQTYILYHLRTITRLDTLNISEEAKSFAEATFMKKKMYYNMRIKTLQRTFSTLRKIMHRAKDRKHSAIDFDLTKLTIAINIATEKGFQPKEITNFYKKIDDKLEQIGHLEKIYFNLKKNLYQTCKQCTHKLITELETGGNIRLEEGKGNEKWYISCMDLLKSRFYPEEMSSYGIQNIEITRVIRIHNRFLRNKFEEKTETLVDITNSNYKKSLEYLFYGVDPKAPYEIFRVIEEGFQNDAKYNNMGLCAFPPLTNSILSCDLARIMQSIENNKKMQKKLPYYLMKKISPTQQLNIFPSGYILICKVLILKSFEDKKYKNFNPEISFSELYKNEPLDKNEYPGDSTVFRTRNKDPKHKLWFVLDSNIVLPEYLIEFDYKIKNTFDNKFFKFGDELEGECFITPNNFEENKDKIDTMFNTYVEAIIDEEDDLNKNNYRMNLNLDIKSQDLDRADLFIIKPLITNYFKLCLNHFGLNLPESNDLKVELLLEIKPEMKLDNLRQLMLCNSNISYLGESLKPCVNLEKLSLAFNYIAEINDGLNTCKNLNFLDLSHNQLSLLQGIESLNELEYLNVSFNNLNGFDYLKILIFNKKLINLIIRCNPMKESQKIHPTVVYYFPQLKMLNNLKIEDSDRKKDKMESEELNEDLIFENAKFAQQFHEKKSLAENWKKLVEILNVSHQKIAKIENLDDLINLRQAYFSNNLIVNIENLDNCKLLEELNLTNNKILKIQNLDNLKFLKKLELGNNKITKLEGIENLVNLMQLSLEDNLIQTLENFPELLNLMEMYFANNSIGNSKEIQNIKHLPKLIILDMSGNPLSKDPNYRIYTLYHLKKLKVLDGISIEITEHQIAKDLFTGRLTEDILLSRLGGFSPQEVMELDLSDCQLRDFEDVFNSNFFPKLKELNLSSNLFMTTGMIGELSSLKILILHSNKIETLIFCQDNNQKKGLNGVQNLEILDVSNNTLKDFNGLQFCLLRSLKILKADNNEIYRVDFLENLISLKELDVSKNRIRQFDGGSFYSGNPIKCLKINDNSLKHFHHIQKLIKLQHIFANNNRINDIPDIERLCDLANLKEVELIGNPISRRIGYRQAVIKKLLGLIYLDGKEILPDEKEKFDLAIPTQPIIEKNPYPNYLMSQVQISGNKVPVKINPVNFEGVFGNVKLPMDNLMHPNYINYSKKCLGSNRKPYKFTKEEEITEDKNLTANIIKKVQEESKNLNLENKESKKFNKEKNEKEISTDSNKNSNKKKSNKMLLSENKLPDGGINIKIQEKETKIYSETEWERIVENDIKDIPYFELQASLRAGIPFEMRPRIWFWLASIEKFENSHSKDIYYKLKNINSEWDKYIENDIDRTFSENDFFKNKDNQKRMFSILRAYCNYDKEVGYMQGMNYIVANLLYHLNPQSYQNHLKSFGMKGFSNDDWEIKCFWIFVFINYNKNWREVFKDGIQKTITLLNFLERKIENENKDIYDHFVANCIDLKGIFVQSFITLIMNFSPFEFSKKIIDVFLLIGGKVIIDILVRVITLCKDEIFALNENEVIFKLNNLKELFNFLKKEIINFCFKKYENCFQVLIPQPQTELYK